jgi:hypothetical protein
MTIEVNVKKLLVLSIALLAACQSADFTPVDPSNATYTIEQRKVTLNGGAFEEPAAPGSAVKATTRLLDKRANGDLNADGTPDAAVVITYSGGGSGTFYYLVALLGTGAGKSASTAAVLLGDRITIEAVRVDGGKVSVDTLDRKPGEPFATAPSVKVTRVFQVKDEALTEIK